MIPGQPSEAPSQIITGGIYKKLHLIMRDVGSIGKDNKNAMQGFKYRSIDQFMNRFNGLLVKHGVLMSPEILNRQDEKVETENKSGQKKISRFVSLVMKYTFIDVDDNSTHSMSMPSEGLDTSDKATGKALSFALKGALATLFMVGTEDNDNLEEVMMIDGDSESPQLNGTELKAKVTPIVKPRAARKSFSKAAAASSGSKINTDDDL